MQDLGSVIFFSIISNFITVRLTTLMNDSLGRWMAIMGFAAMGLMTVWIMFQGYLIATGQSNSSMMAFVMRAVKVFVVLMIAVSATGPIMGTSFLNRMGSLSDLITNAVTSKNMVTESNAIPGSASFDKIDTNLKLMQMGLAAIKSIDTGGDQSLEDEKGRALMMSGVGTAGPGLVAGVLLLLNKVAMVLFVGFAPLFILFFAFKQTEPMFWTWLKFGISTMFSLAVLTFMTGLSMEMVARLAGAVFVSDLLGTNTQGITAAAMQQGGLGLILSTLIITVPPMVGQFFGAQINAFNSSSHFGQIGAPTPAAPPAANTNVASNNHSGAPAAQGASTNVPPTPPLNHSGRTSQSASTAQPDTIKTNSTMGNAQSSAGAGAGASAQAIGSSPATPESGSYSNANANQSVASKGIGDDSAAVNQKYASSPKTEANP